MSRRYRLEQEYLRQLRAEAEEEEGVKGESQHRFAAPVHWATLKDGFSIDDVVCTDHNEIIEMLRTEYLLDDVLCRNTELLEDEVSLQSTLDHIAYTLRDTTSIKVVHEEEDGSHTLAGALLLRISRRDDFDRVFSRTILQEGEARQKCTAIQTALNRQVDIFRRFGCDSMLRYYMLCVKSDFRRQRLGFQLMRVGLDVARSLHLPLVSGIFCTYSGQKYAKRLGFKLLQEISYTGWRDRVTNEPIFSDPGPGNYTCALMACVVPTEARDDPSVVHQLSPMEQIVISEPRTRAEKRARLYNVL